MKDIINFKNIFTKYSSEIDEFIHHQCDYELNIDMEFFAEYLVKKNKFTLFKGLLNEYQFLKFKHKPQAVAYLSEMCSMILNCTKYNNNALIFLDFLSEDQKSLFYNHSSFIKNAIFVDQYNDLIVPYWKKKLTDIFPVMNFAKLLTNENLWSMVKNHPDVGKLKITTLNRFNTLFCGEIKDDRVCEVIDLIQIGFDPDCMDFIMNHTYNITSLRKCLMVLDICPHANSYSIARSVIRSTEDDSMMIRKIFDHPSMTHIKNVEKLNVYLKPEVALIFQERYLYLDMLRRESLHPYHWIEMRPSSVYFLLSQGVRCPIEPRRFEKVPVYFNLFDITSRREAKLNPRSNDLMRAIIFGKPLSDVKVIVEEMKRRKKLAQNNQSA